MSSSYNAYISIVELSEIFNLSSLNVDLDGVSNLDIWLWIVDGTTVMGNNVWDSTWTDSLLLNLAQLEFGFRVWDGVNRELTTNIIDQTEVLISLLDGDNIHKTSWVAHISTDLTVNLNE